MALSRINSVSGVDESRPSQRLLAELCRVLFDTQRKLMEVNNECVDLRSELEEVKRRVG
jgi:hypothetical protein